ncbi:Uu.00g129320.m01.CDS01 [Anthostomella pinea]|uniref:Uu.00g129320.m01.CDS01 n=1 Tax=Anthostomella pinea TaxID=933095 RepID=A0AAI8VIH8_9PEZI|nr:Uu.00g129320.m01.CDS01 [Anthostomella pinea]
MAVPDSPFRVVVVGAGISGLVASHCLQKAGVDHVVLERRDEVAPFEGASISIYPQVVRVLHQIGCLEPLLKIGVPHEWGHIRRPDGTLAGSLDLFRRLAKNHGHDLLPMERREFLRVLHEGLPDKTFIRTGCKITDIREFSDRVEVTMGDGTVEKGDMVLGCDGVYSYVRRLMWDHANKVHPGLIPKQEQEAGFAVEWKCLIGVGPPAPSLGAADLTFVHENRFSFVLLAQPHCTFFFVLFLLDKPLRSTSRVRYTDQEAEALAASIADHPLTDSLKFSELWDNRTRGALISLEEGVLEHWHHGRIVLAGDAVHKATPNIALGGNTAMEDIVVLCNQLHALLGEHGGTRPSAAALDSLFATYQEERKERAKYIVSLSGLASRVQAGASTLHKVAGWLMPKLPVAPVASDLSKYIRAGPKLDYVKVRDFAAGRLAWKDDEEMEKRMRSKVVGGNATHSSGVRRLWQMASAAGAVVMLFSAAWVARCIPGIKLESD